MKWEQRIANYGSVLKFPVAMGVCQGKVYGMWTMGNDYKIKSGYYGGYPPTYLKRIAALFPDKKRVLHLFSGAVDLESMPGDTVDLDPATNPTYLDDAQTLWDVPLHEYDLVLCDPPYSVEDANHYMPAMINRGRVFKALSKLPDGAHVVWLDQVMPMYRKADWTHEGSIGMQKSTNHRFRVVSFFSRNDL